MLEKIDTKLTAFELYTIFKEKDHSFILDSSLNNSLGRYSLISAQPFKVLKFTADEQPLQSLRAELKKYQVENNTHLPFIGGAVGYLAYDLCHAIEDLPRSAKKELAVPDLYLGLYNWVLVIDHRQEEVYFASPDLNRTTEEQIKQEVIAEIKSAERDNPSTSLDLEIECSQLESNFSQEEYLTAIKQIKKYIETGAIYQVNLSQKLTAQINCTGYQLYKRLRELSPAPFGALLEFPEVEVLSNSPERFIKVHDGMIQTRPIKGTRPRGKTEEEDKRMRRELLASEKDKAELLMIVDLERNDLAKASELGSVKVPELYQLEEYQNVHHLVATIESKLK
ncbi:MAG: anthranilate synthase component I family protein, partial [Halanaerobacter sp.]